MVTRRTSASGGGVLPQPGSPVRRGASQIAAAAAAAAANGLQPLHGSSVAAGSDSLSEAAATADSTAAAHSVSTDALGSEEGGDEERGKGAGNSSNAAAPRSSAGGTVGGDDGGSSPFKAGRGPQRGLLFGHGLPCAVEVLSFLIECVARRGDESPGGVLSPVDEDYVVFGLQMAHRALLAGGPVLADHDSLLSLLHRWG
jgi:hypothetical protein